jgi:hypothetical protein
VSPGYRDLTELAAALSAPHQHTPKDAATANLLAQASAGGPVDQTRLPGQRGRMSGAAVAAGVGVETRSLHFR